MLGLLTQSLVGLGQAERAIAARERFLARQTGDDAAGVRNLIEIANCYAQLPDDAKEQQTLEAAIALAQGRDKQKLLAEYADLLDRLAQVLDRSHSDAEARRRWTEAAAVYESLITPVATEPRALQRQMQYCQSLEAIYQRVARWADAIRVTRRLLEHRQADDVARRSDDLAEQIGPGLFLCQAGRRRRTPSRSVAGGGLLAPARAAGADRAGPHAEQPGRGRPQPRRLCRSAEVPGRSGADLPADLRRRRLRLAEVYSNLAGVLSAQGRYKAAIDEYRRGGGDLPGRQGCRHASGPSELLATTLVNTAMLYKSQRQFREAARYCSEALEVQRSLTDVDESRLVPFYSALASLYLAQDQAHPTGPAAVSVDLGQAAKFTEQARELCQKYNLLEQPAGIVVLQLEAMIHFARESWTRARKASSRRWSWPNAAGRPRWRPKA